MWNGTDWNSNDWTSDFILFNAGIVTGIGNRHLPALSSQKRFTAAAAVVPDLPEPPDETPDANE